jgi:hypothetical protein
VVTGITTTTGIIGTTVIGGRAVTGRGTIGTEGMGVTVTGTGIMDEVTMNVEVISAAVTDAGLPPVSAMTISTVTTNKEPGLSVPVIINLEHRPGGIATAGRRTIRPRETTGPAFLAARTRPAAAERSRSGLPKCVPRQM